MTTIKVTPEQLMTISKQFELAQQKVTQMNSILIQQISSMERFWDGVTKEQFYYSFQTSQKNMNGFVTLTDSVAKELRRHADKFRLADLLEAGNIDSSCLPPPPNSCAPPAPDTRNALEKSADSLVELGEDFLSAAEDRYEKRYDSVGGFLDYWTFGIPKGLYQGYAERASKQFDSGNDFFNFWTFGVHGTIREAMFPTNAWSKEHWANMIGTAGIFGGVSSVIKPKIGLGSSMKYEVKSGASLEVKGTSNRLSDTMLGKNNADPFRDIYGPGRLSHPEEWGTIIKNTQGAGVEVRILDRDIMAYAPKGSGKPGQLNIYEDASISALRHEYQHFLDDKAKGFPSLDVTYEFKNRIIMELRAYMVEIKEAERIGNKDLAEHLWNNYRDERQYLLENYGPVKLD
ncbi:WXG100 family type VII secretion target [Paenibacillus sp. AK121]|uniref:WXG100 family type VII secretion target n=1 Tax=Paenibacillus TaxID=44249 RepID=UPI001C23C965|nr:WXG100 family type VII secretion target [Paenibacillus sp. AK121]MBU9705343.1 WXG100 family type VII secretion target [Paenibacillus sp. AK121]MEE4568585.1 WXG100 family type VII secretion target [Paenibacillus polymyxa]